jgi:hypothetical protein
MRIEVIEEPREHRDATLSPLMQKYRAPRRRRDERTPTILRIRLADYELGLFQRVYHTVHGRWSHLLRGSELSERDRSREDDDREGREARGAEP